MKTFRIVRDRVQAQRQAAGVDDDSSGIRGLNDLALFRQAGFRAQLKIVGAQPDNSDLREILPRYSLQRIDDEREHSGGELTVGVKPEAGLSPDLQAATLFFAALEVSRAVHGVKLLIYSVNGLRDILAERLGSARNSDKDSKKESNELLIHHWREKGSSFSLHEPIVLSLSMAQLIPDQFLGKSDQGLHHLDPVMLHAMILSGQGILSQGEPQTLRKVA
jgi:hypothetical protein